MEKTECKCSNAVTMENYATLSRMCDEWKQRLELAEARVKKLSEENEMFKAKYESDKAVDVTGVDRKQLLEALWKNAKPVMWFNIHPELTPTFNIKRAMQELNGTYARYICGRMIEVYVLSDENLIASSQYDNEYGQGSFQRVVDSLRSKNISFE